MHLSGDLDNQIHATKVFNKFSFQPNVGSNIYYEADTLIYSVIWFQSTPRFVLAIFFLYRRLWIPKREAFCLV